MSMTPLTGYSLWRMETVTFVHSSCLLQCSESLEKLLWRVLRPPLNNMKGGTRCCRRKRVIDSLSPVTVSARSQSLLFVEETPWIQHLIWNIQDEVRYMASYLFFKGTVYEVRLEEEGSSRFFPVKRI